MHQYRDTTRVSSPRTTQHAGLMPYQARSPDFCHAGKLGHHTVNRNREDILKDFTYSGKGILKEARHSAWIGARKVGKTGMRLGAIGGGMLGFATAIVATISFPPSLLAMGVSTAIGAAKGALAGGAIAFVLGGMYHGIKTALYLTLKSPEKRLRAEARSGKEELELLMKRHKSGREQLRGKALERLEYLQKHVPFWEGLIEELENLTAEKTSATTPPVKAPLLSGQTGDAYFSDPSYVPSTP